MITWKATGQESYYEELLKMSIFKDIIQLGIKEKILESLPIEQTDNITNPSYYTKGKIECIDALESATKGLEGMEAVLTAKVIKYLWRWKWKNGVEDLKKARWYLDKLIGGLDGN